MNDLRNKNGILDEINIKIIEALAVDARTSMADLARATGLSAPSVTERVRRLEEAAVIVGYAAKIDPVALGYPLGVYIRIRPMAGEVENVAALVSEIEEIVECHRVTGDDCFVAKAHLRAVDDLEPLVNRLLPYAQTQTSIILSSPVRSRPPPVNSK